MDFILPKFFFFLAILHFSNPNLCLVLKNYFGLLRFSISVLVVNEVLIFGVILRLKTLSVVAVRVQGLLDPQEVILGPFSEPSLPEDGQRLNVRVRHLQTPNEVIMAKA